MSKTAAEICQEVYDNVFMDASQIQSSINENRRTCVVNMLTEFAKQVSREPITSFTISWDGANNGGGTVNLPDDDTALLAIQLEAE